MRRVPSVAGLLLVASVLCFAQGQPGARIPTLTYLEGDVTINGVSASIGDTIPLGAVVKTSAASLADIDFNLRNAIRLSENTTFVFNPDNLRTGSELRQGTLTLVLKKLSASVTGPAFLVRTPSAVAGVRGTSFFVKVESATSTYVCACNGVVQVLESGGKLARELVASHHKAVRISSEGSAAQITDAPMLYHTDEDLEKVAGTIGVSIDWNVVDR